MRSLLKTLRHKLGPGFITGASDDDPSGIGTYSQTGVQFHYQQLWTALFTWPLMVAIQEMCGRIGLVTGRGLAAVMKQHYAKPILYGTVVLLSIANVVNIGANLGAMAAVSQLLFGGPAIWWLFCIAIITVALEIGLSYRVYARYLKYLTVTLVAYIVTAFLVQPHWPTVIQAVVLPSFNLTPDFIMNIVAIFGTTFSPYLFFWQTSEEVEEAVANHKLRNMNTTKPRVAGADIQSMRLDTMIGMLFSNVIMFFIMLTSAATLGEHGIITITTAAEAAEALRPLAGPATYWLFALGILGTGLLAIPVLAGSMSYAVSEIMGWREGLYRSFHQAHGFYGTIAVATIIGIAVNFSGIPPFTMLYYTAILNGLCAPPLILIILLIANNKTIMQRYRNNWLSNLLGTALLIVMTASGLWLLWSMM
ncbi:MAG: divalent metal cation transporter [Candidatus Kerfeldbacteria bacterium]|nr:divalent metal cation transporter [Candidatus Kerfeldbacteria bacterium]